MAKEKKKRKGLFITLGILITVVLLLLASLIFVESTIKDLSDSIDENLIEVEEAFDARSTQIKEVVKLLKPKMSLDSNLFTELEKADKELKKAVGVKAKSDANIKVDAAIDKIFHAMEDKYPYLQSTVWDSGVDENIDTARSRIVMKSTDYNKVVKDYNYAIENFPGDFIAGIFGHEAADSFQIVDYDDIAY